MDLGGEGGVCLKLIQVEESLSTAIFSTDNLNVLFKYHIIVFAELFVRPL